MILHDLNALTAKNVVAPAAKTTTFTSGSINLQQFIETAKLVLEVGTVSGTTPTLDVKVQDSADNSSFADVTGLAFTQVTASTNSQALLLDTRALRQYIQLVCTIGGTTPSFSMCAELVGVVKKINAGSQG